MRIKGRTHPRRSVTARARKETRQLLEEVICAGRGDGGRLVPARCGQTGDQLKTQSLRLQGVAARSHGEDRGFEGL